MAIRVVGLTGGAHADDEAERVGQVEVALVGGPARQGTWMVTLPTSMSPRRKHSGEMGVEWGLDFI